MQLFTPQKEREKKSTRTLVKQTVNINKTVLPYVIISHAAILENSREKLPRNRKKATRPLQCEIDLVLFCFKQMSHKRTFVKFARGAGQAGISSSKPVVFGLSFIN